ncbi:MAG: glycoside hydrolase family 127 protein [Roseburia sp.]|nr:glycoside hydrolase family 127 protein [Roseburia sp.]
MYHAELSDIVVGGELKKRQHLSFKRMQEEQYQPKNFFKDITYDWPGDHEGRVLLALVMTAQATHREPEYLERIMEEFPDRLNCEGFLGKLFCKDCIDEQQISGHSWLLRGLVELYRWKKSEQALQMIKDIVNNLFLKTKGFYQNYPIEKNDRQNGGAAAGNLTGQVKNGWALSTDVGCAFIALDGVTAAYELLKVPDLKELIQEMIERFRQMDFNGLYMQTHATLTAQRGILRYYSIIKDENLLKYVQKAFREYTQTAITAHFANHNWFGRPEWTEPCAIIDSFIVAVQLWEYTKVPDYLELAHKIYFNAMGHAQRPNGGFGCDNCPGANGLFLYPMKDIYEAFWCCTMRGADRISLAANYIYWIEKNTLYTAFYHDSTVTLRFHDGTVTLKQKTDYPISGKVRFEVLDTNCVEPKTVKLFLPACEQRNDVVLMIGEQKTPVLFESGFVIFETYFRKGDIMEFSFPLGLYKTVFRDEFCMQEYEQIFHGPLLLGISGEEEIGSPEMTDLEHTVDACYRLADSEKTLEPINKITFLPAEDALQSKLQVLFLRG